MKIELVHSFWKKIPKAVKEDFLNQSFQKIENWEKWTQKNSHLPGILKAYRDENDFIGAAFEALIECFIKVNECDRRIGISEYEPTSKNDNGVDGIGKSLDGGNVAVQVKYRSNHFEDLTAGKDNLNSFVAESFLRNFVTQDEIKNQKGKQHLYIFTSAKGLHYYTKNEKFNNKVNCINWNNLRKMLNNNTHFWNSLKESI